MPRPASFRLPDELLSRIDEEAADRQTSVTALVSTLLDEGLKTRRFPGIVYREGPSGRRPGVVAGPDVWEIVAAIKHTPGRGERRVRRVAEELSLPLAQIRLALDFYAAYPEEIDERIASNERAGRRLRKLIDRREQLLSR